MQGIEFTVVEQAGKARGEALAAVNQEETRVLAAEERQPMVRGALPEGTALVNEGFPLVGDADANVLEENPGARNSFQCLQGLENGKAAGLYPGMDYSW